LNAQPSPDQSAPNIISPKKARRVLTMYENRFQNTLRQTGLHGSFAAKIMARAVNGYVNAASRAVAVAIDLSVRQERNEHFTTAIYEAALDRARIAGMPNPNDETGLSLDVVEPQLDQPFVRVIATTFTGVAPEYPETVTETKFMDVPRGILALEEQIGRILKVRPERGLATMFQAFMSYMVETVFRDDRIVIEGKHRFRDNIRILKQEGDAEMIQFIVERTTGQTVPGAEEGDEPQKIGTTRVLFQISPSQMFDSARVDHWYPELFAAQDAALAEQARLLAAKAEEDAKSAALAAAPGVVEAAAVAAAQDYDGQVAMQQAADAEDAAIEAGEVKSEI
jgi:hypothetical protein